MPLDFDYEYNPEKCWFRKVCKHKDDLEYCNNKFCLLYDKMHYLCNMALLSNKDRYPITLVPDADGTDRDKFIELKDIQLNINDFVTKGKNLLIFSKNTGNGKTSWSKKLLLAWFTNIIYFTDYTCRGLFVNVVRYFNELKNNINKSSDYIEHINTYMDKADLIVWDEIGIKNITPFEHDNLLNCINMRLENGQANIFTSNMTPEELKEKLGDRLYSRIVQSSIVIELNGMDKRALSK